MPEKRGAMQRTGSRPSATSTSAEGLVMAKSCIGVDGAEASLTEKEDVRTRQVIAAGSLFQTST